MRRMKLSALMFVVLLVVSIPLSAQDEVVLQLAIPFFAEDLLQPVIDEFELANPGIRVQLVPNQGFGIPVQDSDDAEEYQDNLATYFSSADVLFVDESLSPEATRAGYLLDLYPLTLSDANFNDSLFHFNLIHSYEWDGGQWALPISTDFVVLSYIPEAFDETGLAYPTDVWTLADLEFATRSLTAYDANGNITHPGLVVTGNNLATLFLSLLGQGVYTDASFPSSPELRLPELEVILETWMNMDMEGLFDLTDGVDIDTIPMLVENPQQGRGGGPLGNQNDPERVMVLLPGGRAGLNVNGYAISSGTLYPEASYRLISYLINDPNAITASIGTSPALLGVQGTDLTQGSRGDGPGGLLTGNIAEELQPLVDTALIQGIPVAEWRFAEGILDAYELMLSDGLTAQQALEDVNNTLISRLQVADTRAQTTQISVQAPATERVLGEGEIELNFAVLGGRGGFALQEQWQEIGATFAEFDPQIGKVNIEAENQNQFAGNINNYDCFYSGTNLVPDTDLDTLLSLDPLILSDPSFDPNDFLPGVLSQVQLNNQTWAMPLTISPLVMRFDSDALNQAGVPLPQGTWTVAEFEDALRQLRLILAEDEYPLEFNQSSQTALLSLIAVYGGVPIDTRTEPITLNFTDPSTVVAIEQVLRLARNDLLNYATGGLGGGFGGGNNQDDSVIPLYSNIINAFGFGGGPGGNFGQNNTDGMVTFPQGNQFNAVAFEIGTAYLIATTQYPDACYRLISFLEESTDLFQSMPVRYSVMNNANLVITQGESNVAFYRSLADLMSQPNTVLFPNNINTGNFGMTTWLLDVFERYIADEVVDLASELALAEQITQDYLVCIAEIDVPTGQGGFQAVIQQAQACQQSVDPASA